MVTRKAHLRKTKTGKIVPVREAKINLTVPSNISDEELKQALYQTLKDQGKMDDLPPINVSENPKNQSDIIGELDQEQLESVFDMVLVHEGIKPKRLSMWMEQILLNPNATHEMFEKSMNHFPWLDVYSQTLPEYLHEEAAENWWNMINSYPRTDYLYKSLDAYIPPKMVVDNSNIREKFSDYVKGCEPILGCNITRKAQFEGIIDASLRDKLMLIQLKNSDFPKDISFVIREGVGKNVLESMQFHSSKGVQNTCTIALRDKNWL